MLYLSVGANRKRAHKKQTVVPAARNRVCLAWSVVTERRDTWIAAFGPLPSYPRERAVSGWEYRTGWRRPDSRAK